MISEANPYTQRKSDHLLLENKAKRKQPQANLSTTTFLSSAMKDSSDLTSLTVRVLACRFSFLLAFAISLRLSALGLTVWDRPWIFNTLSQYLMASMKLLAAEAEASSSCSDSR